MTRKRFVKLLRGFSTECYVVLRDFGIPVSSRMIFTGRGFRLPEGMSYLDASMIKMADTLSATLEIARRAEQGGERDVL